MTQPRKKLIEVALPLEAINKESARDKSPGHPHPSDLHLWWARRPLAACRAVLFASLVDDPSSCSDEFPTAEAQQFERLRLFEIIENLVRWENLSDLTVIHKARTEIARSTARAQGVLLPRSLSLDEVEEALGHYAPSVLDPFCGGGSIPVEAQRLGLAAYASDLNPVAVLITKAQIEIPPKFAGRPPVNPDAGKMLLQQEWRGAQGLAEDVRYYGKWMRDEAEKRIGYLYPKVSLPKEYGGGEATVMAWIWARTVKCPNPACGSQIPLVHSFALSTKQGKEAWVEPVIDRSQNPPLVRFEVRTGNGTPPPPTKVGDGAKFKCLCCEDTTSDRYIRDEGTAGRMGLQLVAIVAEGPRRRYYLSPTEEQVSYSNDVGGDDLTQPLPDNARWFSPPLYGMKTYRDLFTERQFIALKTFAGLVGEARLQVLKDSSGDIAYADAIATYLAFPVDRAADYWASTATWYPANQQIGHTFTRQAIPMTWDFAEANPFSNSSGSWRSLWSTTLAGFEGLPEAKLGAVKQLDATEEINGVKNPMISTDPPYYANIGYADLSDFFYVWLRESLNKIYPDLFKTMLTPKTQELIATPYRFEGNQAKAKRFFEEGLSKAFARMRQAQHPDYPLTIYYAFKQTEIEAGAADALATTDLTGSALSTRSEIRVSTGWETMLEGLLRSGFAITGTWPMRSEQHHRMVAHGTNALASSIVLVCRPRAADAPLTSRGEFLRALKRELPAALKDLQRGHIAPVDLAQAAIGPGMAVFSRYSKVLEADGAAMRVRTALQLINQALDEVLAEQEGEYDADTRWAVAWFEQYGMEEGPYGIAETLSKAKNTAVERLVEAGILSARGGKVRLLRRDELEQQWTPAHQARLTVWEVTQRLIRALDKEGEQGAAAVLDHASAQGEIARDLAYRLYTTCERKGWTQEALAYNSLVVEWRDIAGQAERLPAAVQSSFGEDF